MTFGNLAGRPDLRPLFGALSSQENDELVDRLVALLEISRELLGRAAYWGPVRVVHVLRLPRTFTLATLSSTPKPDTSGPNSASAR